VEKPTTPFRESPPPDLHYCSRGHRADIRWQPPDDALIAAAGCPPPRRPSIAPAGDAVPIHAVSSHCEPRAGCRWWRPSNATIQAIGSRSRAGRGVLAMTRSGSRPTERSVRAVAPKHGPGSRPGPVAAGRYHYRPTTLVVLESDIATVVACPDASTARRPLSLPRSVSCGRSTTCSRLPRAAGTCPCSRATGRRPDCYMGRPHAGHWGEIARPSQLDVVERRVPAGGSQGAVRANASNGIAARFACYVATAGSPLDTDPDGCSGPPLADQKVVKAWRP
jgi:hypothetical protein